MTSANFPINIFYRSEKNMFPKEVLQIAPGQWAGHMRIYHRICLSLATSAYKVSLLAHENISDKLSANNFEFHSLGKMEQATLDWRLLNRYIRCQNAYNYCKNTPASLIQFYSPEFISWGLRLKINLKLPVIFDCMEDFPGYVLQRPGIPNIMRIPFNLFLKSYLSITCRNFDAVTVADEGTGNFFSHFAKRVVIIHNYPQKSLFPDPGKKVIKKFDVIFYGSLPRYILTELLKIDDALSNHGKLVKWRLIGIFTEKAWFLNQLNERNASDRFTISGHIPHNQMAHEIQESRIGIIPLPDLPKFRNNIPQKLFEFMAMRIPVVLSDLPPTRRFITNDNFGYKVQPSNYRDYANAIIKLLDNSSMQETMGQNARLMFEKELNWEAESSKLLNLYNDILST